MRYTVLSALAALSLAARAAPPPSGPQPVTVENTPSVNVANTPSVTVTNVPGVTVTNSPTVQLAQGSTVVIGNAAGAPVPVRNVDLDAHGAFQAEVSLNWLAGQQVAIAIPAGKRLVVDFIAIHCAAASSGGGIQPDVLLYSSLNGGPAIPYYFPLAPSPTAATQFALAQPLKLYADSLVVSLAFAGFAPDFFVAGAAISGHLVDP